MVNFAQHHYTWDTTEDVVVLHWIRDLLAPEKHFTYDSHSVAQEAHFLAQFESGEAIPTE